MFKKLLVPVDRSPLAEQALGMATAIARASHADIDVVLVHEPLPFGAFFDAPWSVAALKDEERYVGEIADEIASGAGLKATSTVLHGDACSMICQRALELDADLIVMTSHGRTGFSRIWLGSVADAVLGHASTPVLMLRPIEGKSRHDAARHLFRHVLAPTDGSAPSEEILAAAISLAKSSGARLTLLHVVQPVPLIVPDAGPPFILPPLLRDEVATALVVREATEQLDSIVARAGEDQVRVEAKVVVADHVAQGVLDFAKGQACDVIAMSTRGRGASRLILGSVADKVLRGSGLPMLLQRPVSAVDADAVHAAADADSLAHV